LHREKDSEDIHIIVPRVELSSGKSMNISPPGWKNIYDPLRDYFNEKYGWVSPDIEQNPAIARLTQLGSEGTNKSNHAKTKKEIKQSIENYLISEIEKGHVRNRQDIVLSLTQLGFDIPRQGKDYITVLDKETNTRIRLKGALYEQSWTIEPTLTETSDKQTSGHRRSNKRRINDLQKELDERISERAKYNTTRYPTANAVIRPRTINNPKKQHKKCPKPTESHQKTVAKTFVYQPINLFWYLQQYNRGYGIFISPYPGSDHRNRSKPEHTKNDGRNSDTESMWREPSALRSDRRESTRIPKWLSHFKTQIKDIYDGTRTTIDQGIKEFIKSIQTGYDNARKTSQQLERTSTGLNSTIQQHSEGIKQNLRNIEHTLKINLANTEKIQEEAKNIKEISSTENKHTI